MKREFSNCKNTDHDSIVHRSELNNNIGEGEEFKYFDKIILIKPGRTVSVVLQIIAEMNTLATNTHSECCYNELLTLASFFRFLKKWPDQILRKSKDNKIQINPLPSN